MFDFIRSHQRLMQFLLLVFVVPSFALIGVSGYSTYVSGDHDLVKVGKSAITQQDFDNARANQLRQLEQSNPSGFDPDILDEPAVRQELLESLVDRRVVATIANQERFNVSDAQLRRAIAAMPQLQEDGKFSPDLYNALVNRLGITTRDFEQSQRAEMALDRVLTPVLASASAPNVTVNHIRRALTETRELRHHSFQSQDYLDTVEVSEDDIASWYEENKESLEIPEQVSLEYLLLNENAVMDTLPSLSDEELQEYYEQNKSRFTQEGRVRLRHIFVKSSDEAADEAAALYAQLEEDPQTFAALAREHSEDSGSARQGGELGWVTRDNWSEKLAKVIFDLDEGEISEPVEGDGGYHIFLAEKVEQDQVESFESVKAEIEEEINHQLGAERFADIATRLTSLVYDHPDSMQAVAQAVGMEVKTAHGIARDRLLTKQEAGDGAAIDGPDAEVLEDARVRRAAFSRQVLNDKHNSGVIEISSDTMLTVRVVDHKDAYIPELKDVSAQVKEILQHEKAVQAAIHAGQEALEHYQAHGLDEDASAAFGDALTVSRINPNGINKTILDTALGVSLDDTPTFVGVEIPEGFVVLNIEGGSEGSDDSNLSAGLSQDLRQVIGEAEEHAVLNALRDQVGIERLPDAESAIYAKEGSDS